MHRFAMAFILGLASISTGCGKSGGTARETKAPQPEAPAEQPGSDELAENAQALPMSAPGAAYASLAIDVGEGEAGREVVVTVEPEPGVRPRHGAVPVSAEPFTISTRVRDDQVSESDLVGTGLAMDLNGDGDTDDRLPVGCNGEAAVIGSTRIEPAMTRRGEVTSWRYEGRPARLGDSGAHLLLYTPCSTSEPMTVGLSPADQPIQLVEVAGPALQVMVLEPQEPGATPEVTVEDVEVNRKEIDPTVQVTYVYEPIVTPEPTWHAASWLLIPFERDTRQLEVRFTVGGAAEDPRLLIVSVQEPGIDGASRARSHLLAQPLR